ncbi:MAG: 2-oxoacid:acceptor oxidoreductase subunit alpha [Candidatus Krumholzibacteriota bacterium]|nr:2-oxoacid:acceptor oxidoreductase subunit alpha [Candidatus Krumholzibacteriota bacterium]
MNERVVNTLIAGEAGQGLQTLGGLFARILVRAGYRIVVTQSYMSRIRGGHNTFAVRASAGKIHAPDERVDLLLCLDAPSIAIHREEMREGGVIVADRADAEGAGDGEGLFAVPFDELPGGIVRGTVALGVLCALLGLDRAEAAETVAHAFEKKKGAEVAQANREAFYAGFDRGAARGGGALSLPAAPGGTNRLVMNGNQAIALGAASAGVRFCSFYPMTPATSVPLTLIGMAERAGIVVEQAEDEIAAVNMAIGASFAGATAMTATSGGGFALMQEGVSLAGATETPLVVVVAQRPGPATGLPTRTEQADLDFVLYAGHGEFPRAIWAPGTVEQCFHLARRAVESAERWQGPMFLLTDQFLADSLRAVEPFDIERLPAVRVGADPASVETPYERYRVTGDGVSPRLTPGAGGHIVVADSDEHTADGHLTENLEARVLQHGKRLRKGQGIRAEAAPPELIGDERPELFIVCWGSTRGAAVEAAETISASGTPAAVMHFSQVWPLVAEAFLPALEAAPRAVCVEGNAAGQFAGLVRRETGFAFGERINRYDGLPITPGFILRGLGHGDA